MNKTFVQRDISGTKANFLDLPGTGIFRLEVVFDRGAHIERVLNKKMNKKLYGMTHLIEHLSFKSTRDYSTDEVNEMLFTLGEYNATTDHDCINFWFKTITEKTSLAIKLVLNIALNDLANLSNEEFLLERDVVYNESEEKLDDNQSMFYRHAFCSIFDYDLEDSVIGIPETINSFSLEDAIELKSYLLNLSNITFNITFDSLASYPREDIIKMIEEELSAFNFNNKIDKLDNEYNKLIGKMTTSEKFIEAKVDKKMHFFTFNNVNDSYTAYYVGKYLSELSGETSLFNLIREKNGLAYDATISEHSFNKENFLVFYCDVKNGTENKMYELFKESINKSTDAFNLKKHKELVNSLSLQRRLSLMNQEEYENIFDFVKENPVSYLLHNSILSKNLDEAFIDIDSVSADFLAIKNLLEKIRDDVNNENFAFVSN